MSAIGKSLARIGLGGEGKVEVPFHGDMSSIDLRLPGDRDPSRTIGDGFGTSIVQAVLNWYINAFPEAQLEVQTQTLRPDSALLLRITSWSSCWTLRIHTTVEMSCSPAVSSPTSRTATPIF